MKMIKSKENYAFIVFSLAIVLQVIFIKDLFVAKVGGIGAGVCLTVALMVMCGMADFTRGEVRN